MIYCGNEKGDNVSLYYSRGFFDINIIIIKDNDGNIERFLAGWKYCNLYYFYTVDLFNLHIFCLIFALRVMRVMF